LKATTALAITGAAIIVAAISYMGYKVYKTFAGPVKEVQNAVNTAVSTVEGIPNLITVGLEPTANSNAIAEQTGLSPVSPVSLVVATAGSVIQNAVAEMEHGGIV